MYPQERQIIRRVAIATLAFYPVAVAILAALKSGTGAFDGMPWPEVVYGPAITIASVLLLVWAAIRVEYRLRDRA